MTSPRHTCQVDDYVGKGKVLTIMDFNKFVHKTLEKLAFHVHKKC